METTSAGAGMIGKYQIIRVLGRGGMGEVLLAQDDLGRRVAIKRPFRSAQDEGLARFKMEARASTLTHPNIPVVYEMGTHDGLPFIAMEFVEGEPLDKIIASGSKINLLTKLSIIEQVCSALGYAHSKGIIHRDIKPANVILQPNGVAKIIDFGIAKITNVEQTSGLTQTSMIVGSLHYIAPERFKGDAVDGRVDVFSAGVILYLLLTGQLPFGGGEATASYKIVNEKHNSLSDFIRDYPPALDQILDQALAKDPEDRYSTAEDFADALHEVIEEQKKVRVFQLFDDAERLTTESRYAPALELLDEALKLDPANTQVRKLRKLVRDHQDRAKRADRLKEMISKADEAVAQENFADALSLLKDAQRLDSASAEITSRLQIVEERKRRYDRSAAALLDAESARNRGDITAALRIAEAALQEDPEHTRLLAVRSTLARQLEVEAQRGKLISTLDAARRELTAQNFPAVDQLLAEAEAIDPSYPRIEEIRRDLNRIRETEERRQLLEELHRRVNDFLRNDQYDQAVDLLDRAIDKLPGETSLHRLKLEVDTAARKFGSKLFVDSAIASAKETFATAPAEALAGLQQAIEKMPGEERLIAYERLLRQQYEARKGEQRLGDCLSSARAHISSDQFDKAIEVLESYNLECGEQADVAGLLALARNELANQQRAANIRKATADAQSLLAAGRLDDAAAALEASVAETKDPSLSRLLDEVREQQAAIARKAELVQKRASTLWERGELDEALRILQEYISTSPQNKQVQNLFESLQADREKRRLAQEAIIAAQHAVQIHNFTAAIDALQAVIRAYGESPELTREIQNVESARNAYAQEEVGKSIESARAALLKNDPNGALAALKTTQEWVGYAPETRQADWKRIGQAARAALAEPGKPITVADLDEPIIARKTPVWIFVAAGIVVVAAIAVVVFVLNRKQPTVATGPTDAHIVIAKAPPGAQVIVDNNPPITIDAQGGDLSITLKPGKHHIQVSKDGFSSFTDDLSLGNGETYRDPAVLTALGKSGTLMASGNVPDFKVFVDGVLRGNIHQGKPLVIEAGTHHVRYAAAGFKDSADKTITIALNQQVTDSFNLDPLPKPVANAANLIVQSNPGAQILVDGGKYSGTANAEGEYTITNIPPGHHTIGASLAGYVAVPSKGIDVQAGQNASINAQLAPMQPTVADFHADPTTIEEGKSTTLTWRVENATSLNIDGIGNVPISGTHTVEPDHTTTYRIIANGNIALNAVTVTVHPKPQPVVVNNPPPTPQPQPVVNTPQPPDAGTLHAALAGSYQNIFTSVSGKNAKECQNAFNNFPGGGLKALSNWCNDAKGFDVQDKCTGAPEGDENSATWGCEEVVTIVTKDGNRLPAKPVHKTFHFARKDGRWRVTGFDQ
ncbi:protein kinase [Acidicapsa dinghuensis]|uniref:Protein kinase n=1 Tax=Acidicapsa dinghuensis TaxID=2218256 RepID=A0ABW1EHT1_9BACT|nr:protein kinase [Acidicapsa dinghuensis]